MENGRHEGRVVDDVLEHLVDDAYARVRLPAATSLTQVHNTAAEFFSMSEEVKLAHMSDFNFGFRPFGRQFSQTPDRPDLNESFTYWADDPTTVPNHERLGPFLAALHDLWMVVEKVADGVIENVGRALGVDARTAFSPNSSYIEVNSYLPDVTRELLQDPHEDGHVLTLVASNAPGLEVEVGGAMQPVDIGPGEVVVMAGSLLTALTDGWIAPTYHQVRNRGYRDRRTVLFLVNPPLHRPVAPLVVHGGNRNVDVAALGRTNRRVFGLPESPILP